MAIYALGELVPDIDPEAYVHPDAVVIGAVTIGAEASVWPGAVLRGDYGRIQVGSGTSIQDGTVLHATATWPTIVGEDCVVGHNVHMEGCTVANNCLIGSGAVVLNGVAVGAGSLVGAKALVTERTQIPPDSMALGMPARIRPVDPDQHRRRMREAVELYRRNGRHYREHLRLVQL